jgi:hypothetical protein
MANPWTKKIPLMSIWLSGANAVAGRVRGHAKAEAAKGVTEFYTQGNARSAAPIRVTGVKP